ncbi:MAG: phosphonoacetaldehyde reductase [Candidatus Wildermuthbacteria bacterium]|nr:phosphonoacetaldehyde reductase [Candidatus Wildermuthbacteria bacterium]
MEKEFIGIGSISRFAEILEHEKPRKIFLVADKGAYGKSGAENLLSPMLSRAQSFVFSDFGENPKIQDIEKGIEEYNSFFPDVVVAVGGGSALDMAKSVNVLANQKGNPLDYVLKRKEITNQGKPLVAIPTTAGTGAEATHFAVIYLDKTKHSLAHAFVKPTYSIVDPQLTFSLPPRITASTGMDALSQAIESFWSNKSTEESKGYAREAISFILPNLSAAVNSPTPEAREAMSKGAHLAGKAIDISQTTASHAISYPITSFFGVPHGHAVGLTIPSMVLFNSEADEKSVSDERGLEYVKETMAELLEMLGSKNGEDTKQKIEDLMKEIHLETKLGDLGIQTKEDRERIVENGFNPERMKNNPRLVTEDVLRSILERIV